MELKIHGSNVEITNAIKDYIFEKIGKLDKYIEHPEDVHANIAVRVKGDDQIIEVTIPIKRFILRAEETHTDLYAAIDLVSEKLERQIKKQKAKMHGKTNKEHLGDFFAQINSKEEESDLNTVVKRKAIELKPMHEEEAILQLELLGHEFFVFKEAQSGSICVLYKRKDGNYGVIKTN